MMSDFGADARQTSVLQLSPNSFFRRMSLSIVSAIMLACLVVLVAREAYSLFEYYIPALTAALALSFALRRVRVFVQERSMLLRDAQPGFPAIRGCFGALSPFASGWDATPGLIAFLIGNALAHIVNIPALVAVVSGTIVLAVPLLFTAGGAAFSPIYYLELVACVRNRMCSCSFHSKDAEEEEEEEDDDDDDDDDDHHYDTEEQDNTQEQGSHAATDNDTGNDITERSPPILFFKPQQTPIRQPAGLAHDAPPQTGGTMLTGLYQDDEDALSSVDTTELHSVAAGRRGHGSSRLNRQSRRLQRYALTASIFVVGGALAATTATVFSYQATQEAIGALHWAQGEAAVQARQLGLGDAVSKVVSEATRWGTQALRNASANSADVERVGQGVLGVMEMLGADVSDLRASAANWSGAAAGANSSVLNESAGEAAPSHTPAGSWSDKADGVGEPRAAALGQGQDRASETSATTEDQASQALSPSGMLFGFDVGQLFGSLNATEALEAVRKMDLNSLASSTLLTGRKLVESSVAIASSVLLILMDFGFQAMAFVVMLFYCVAATSTPLHASLRILPISNGMRRKLGQILNSRISDVSVLPFKRALAHAAAVLVTAMVLDMPAPHLATVTASIAPFVPIVPASVFWLPWIIASFLADPLYGAITTAALITTTAVFDSSVAGQSREDWIESYLQTLAVGMGFYIYGVVGTITGPLMLIFARLVFELVTLMGSSSYHDDEVVDQPAAEARPSHPPEVGARPRWQAKRRSTMSGAPSSAARNPNSPAPHTVARLGAGKASLLGSAVSAGLPRFLNLDPSAEQAPGDEDAATPDAVPLATEESSPAVHRGGDHRPDPPRKAPGTAAKSALSRSYSQTGAKQSARDGMPLSVCATGDELRSRSTTDLYGDDSGPSPSRGRGRDDSSSVGTGTSRQEQRLQWSEIASMSVSSNSLGGRRD